MEETGREGRPLIAALAYFSGDTAEQSQANLVDYYTPMGADIAEMIAGSALRSVEAVSAAIGAFAEAGVDELIFDPTIADVEQVDLLAEAVL